MDNLIRLWQEYLQYADVGMVGVIVVQALILTVGVIVFLVKRIKLYRYQRRHQRIISGFWGASTLGTALEMLSNDPGAHFYNILACRGVQAVNVRNKQAAEGVLVRLSLAQLLSRYLRQGMREVRVQLKKGTAWIYWSLFLLLLIGTGGFVWQMYMAMLGVSDKIPFFTIAAPAMLPLLLGVIGAVLMLICHALLQYAIKQVDGNLKAFRSDLQGYLVDVLGEAKRTAAG